MNSYLERERGKVRTLNADAESFVPVATGQPPLCTSAGDHHIPCSMGVRPKVISERQPQVTTSYHLPKLEPKLKESGTQSIDVGSQLKPNYCPPLIQDGSDHLLSVLERQNEITSSLFSAKARHSGFRW